MDIINKLLVKEFQRTQLIVLFYANEFLVCIFNDHYNIGPYLHYFYAMILCFMAINGHRNNLMVIIFGKGH